MEETFWIAPDRFWWKFLCDILDGEIKVIPEEKEEVMVDMIV